MVASELENLVEDRMSKLGVHLIDIVIRGDGKGKIVEIFVDSEKGVTTEICSEVSREIGGMIESSGVVRGSYRLTVSSPGIERPLKYFWQYRKHVGRDMQLKLRTGEGVRDVSGKLESMDDRTIMLLSRKTGVQESIAIDDIVEALVKAPW